MIEEGYVVIMSRGVEGWREYAEVGYMVAPWMRKLTVSFYQASSRMASLKIRIQGGKMSIVTAYVPTHKYELSERQDLFHPLAEFLQKQSAHGPKLVFGGFNARVLKQLLGEDDIIGPHISGNLEAHIDAK